MAHGRTRVSESRKTGRGRRFLLKAALAGRFSWDTSGNGVLTDPDELQTMTAEEALAFLFKAE